MSSQAVNTMRFDASPDDLFKVLTSPAFQEANFVGQGNPAAKITTSGPAGDVLKMEALVTEYAKGLTGIDKSKTEKTRTEFSWNLAQHVCDWIYHSTHEKKVRVWGRVTARTAGSGSELVEEFNIEVKVPLVGGKVEKMVITEAKKYWPKYEALVREFLAK